MAGIEITGGSESIATYRGKIKKAINDLTEQLKKTERALDTVKDGWNDEQFNRFRDNFNVDKEQIRTLCDILGEYDNVILSSFENDLKEYEGLKMNLN